MNHKVGIFIPSYKNRVHELFEYIVAGGLDKYDVFIVLSDNDDKLKEYYDYAFPNNVMMILTNCKTIGEKRQTILDFAKKHGFKTMVEIDDDVRSHGYVILSETKRTTSNTYHKNKIPLVDIIDKMVESISTGEYAFVSPTFPFSIGFNWPGRKLVNSSLNYAQMIALNVDDVIESGIKYDTSPTMIEDVDFVLQLIQHGKNCMTLGDYAFDVYYNKSIKYSSVVNLDIEHFNIKQMNFYLKYGDGIRLTIRKNGEIGFCIKTKKYWNKFDIPIIDDEYHRTLKKLCEAKDIKGLKTYIIENTKKKNSSMV